MAKKSTNSGENKVRTVKAGRLVSQLLPVVKMNKAIIGVLTSDKPYVFSAEEREELEATLLIVGRSLSKLNAALSQAQNPGAQS